MGSAVWVLRVQEGFAGAMAEWLKRMLGKRVHGKPYRGFEPRPLRQMESRLAALNR